MKEVKLEPSSTKNIKNDDNSDIFSRYLTKNDKWDKKVISKIYHRYEGSKIRKLAINISYFGDPRLWGLIFIIFGIYGLINLNFTYFIIFFFGFFQSFAIYYLIKKIFKRKRPFQQFEKIIRLDKTGHGFSFPSGHCHHSTILIGLLGLVFFQNLWFVGILLIYNVLIAVSRLISGCHFPFDTIFANIEAYIELLFFWKITKDFYLDTFIGIIDFIFSISL